MTFVVGLTGGIASGKTTVAELFSRNFGIDIVDADIIAREVVARDTPGLDAIKNRFGHEIILDDGSLNRAKLREIIFTYPEEKQWLDQLLHPMIREKMQLSLSQVSSPYALLVVPLLVENQLQYLAQRILVVDVSESTQIDRVMLRDGVSRQQALNILSSQATRAERLAIANDVIKNDTKNNELLSRVTELHQKYLAIISKNL
ncbi:Dephospho-CoA kinase [Vibrio aerogenes CECT 7868]|uniref:Dephospho-CoA kinase n=1 Tax=Vibrio aerogenes CECT 7868 TaxID=1216006 RepID=A0A1M5YGC5_9VIBR|nr:dephospho-CoA kinase [Vibrio aerogenes]SHI11036.1 Dephospho-CoA kinase [Vibrio aerogenes CECT 7868]